MKRFGIRFGWGVVAVGIYMVTVIAVLWYFNLKKSDTKRRYVQKNDDRIQIALAASVLSDTSLKKRPPKPHPPKHTQNKTSVKKTSSHKKEKKAQRKKTARSNAKKKTIAKKKIRKRDVNRTARKKSISTKSLFASVKMPQKPHIVISKKPIHTSSSRRLFSMVDAHVKSPQSSLKKQERKVKGIKNAYLAKVQRMLEDWPAQSDFTGERVKVYLKIRPDGFFNFEFKQKADNPEFNESLRAYLEQLQTIGFGPHEGKRTYLFEAEFVAKD